MENKFIKNCPDCDIEMSYSRKDSLKNSIKNNTLCNSCSRIKKTPDWAKAVKANIDTLNNLFSKYCPKCKVEMSYSRKDVLKESIVHNSVCRSCSKKGKHPAFYIDGKIPEDILFKMSKTWFNEGHRPANADTRKGKTLEGIYGNEKAKEIRELYSAWERTEEGNLKRANTMRIYTIKYLKSINGHFHPPYNKRACKFFDNLMNETNTQIKHALNGGEFHIKKLGFWVDGYDKENNIVYEFDESHHFNSEGKLKKKDIQRQKLITEHLNCRFIRIKESEVED